MTSNNLISPMKFCYNTNSTLPKQCQSSRSVLQDGSRTFGLFWKEKTLSYNRKNTVPETKTGEFANSVDLDEVAHYEPPHLDLHCLPYSLSIPNMI